MQMAVSEEYHKMGPLKMSEQFQRNTTRWGPWKCQIIII